MSAVLPQGEDTIAAIATAPGRGAIALVRLSGPEAWTIGRRVIADFDAITPRVVQLTRVHHPVDGTLIDRALVTLFPAPRSYTGDDLIEFSVHGGALVPTLVVSALCAAGARQALPGEFTRRAVANGRMDLLQAEAVADLIDAQSRIAHQVALSQLEGGLSHRAVQLRDAVLDVEALIAYDIDFPEEDQGTIDRHRVADAIAGTIRMLDDLLSTRSTGEMLRNGALVVIGGAPNAGKSSLFNALVGRQRAIVTDIPGTTRDAIEALVEIDRWPVRLVDTAGLRESTDVVERLGIEVTERYLGSADVIVLCAETTQELAVLRERTSRLTSAAHIPIRTKADLSLHQLEPGPHDVLSISTLTGDGVERLSERVASVISQRFGTHAEDAPLLTRERHRQAVDAARSELLAFQDAWDRNDPPSAVAATHLRQAAHHLAELIGSVDSEAVLERVFSTFCVGK